MDEDDEQSEYELFTGVEDSASEPEDESANEPIITPEDRPRGILSPTDREYLCGMKDYSHSQTELNRRQAIRERTIEAIRDFNLLWLSLEVEEREKIMDAFEAEELNRAFSSMLALLYAGIDQDMGRMEEILERGLHLGANYDTSGRWSGNVNNVDVDIDIEYDPDIEQLYQRVQEGDSDQLTPAEIGALVRAGKLDSEDLAGLEETKPTVYLQGRPR